MAAADDDFINILRTETKISHYITSTPFSTVDNSNYGGRLTPDLFQRHFLVDGGISSARNSFYECLVDANLNAFLLFGYKGCGKTVLVNYLVNYLAGRKLGSREIACTVVDFEKERERDVDSKFKTGLIRLIKRTVYGYDYSHERDREFLQSKKNCLLAIYGQAVGLITEYEVEQELSSFVGLYNQMPVMADNENMAVLERRLQEMTEASLILIASFLMLCEDVSRLGNANVKHVFVFDNLDDELDETVISQFIGAFEGYSAAYATIFNELRNLKVSGYDLRVD